MKCYISKCEDISNIFHIFNTEISQIWNAVGPSPKSVLLLENYIDSSPGRWRFDLLKSIYPNLYTKALPAELTFDSVVEIPEGDGLFSSFHFQILEISPSLVSLADRIKRSFGTENVEGTRVVYIERGRDRILYDHPSRRLLGDFLKDRLGALNIPFSVVNFDHATFDYQVKTLADAKVLVSCHGAANTNLFLLPSNGHLFEVNFRKFWNCDPVCDAHKSGLLPYTSRCDGPLIYAETFHKADYFNLAQLFGIRYEEFEIEDADNFLTDNPIVLERVYVNGDLVVEEIKRVFE